MPNGSQPHYAAVHVSSPGASPHTTNRSRRPSPSALLRLSEVLFHAGPPYFVRVPPCLHACKPGRFIPRSEFLARHHGHPLDGAGCFLIPPRHLPALLLVKGSPEADQARFPAPTSPLSQESVFCDLKRAHIRADAALRLASSPCDSAHSELRSAGLLGGLALRLPRTYRARVDHVVRRTLAYRRRPIPFDCV